MEEEYRKFLNKRGMDSLKIDVYIDSVKKVIRYFEKKGTNICNDTVANHQEYVANLIKKEENSYDNLMAVGRYAYLLDLKKVWIYYASILGGNTVLPSIRERLTEIEGTEVCNKVFNGVDEPPLGSNPEAYPTAVKQLMDQLTLQLKPEVYKRVLAGNHHRIPVEAFFKYKEWLKENDGDISEWLKRIHDFAVADLELHLCEDKVWYEQIITEEIIEYVKNNQEVLSGVKIGDWIYNTKFPYAPQEYLNEKDPLMKRYFMCHCPLARTAILSDHQDIPIEWCYCSAGYSKQRYDIAFCEETQVELLESVFGGSDKCRFKIKIPEKWR